LSFLKINQYIFDLINGIFLGFSSILIEIILRYFDSGFSIPIFFIVGLIILIEKNEIVSMTT
jgi:hypothetical protein